MYRTNGLISNGTVESVIYITGVLVTEVLLYSFIPHH